VDDRAKPKATNKVATKRIDRCIRFDLYVDANIAPGPTRKSAQLRSSSITRPLRQSCCARKLAKSRGGLDSGRTHVCRCNLARSSEIVGLSSDPAQLEAVLGEKRAALASFIGEQFEDCQKKA
jgi:hypothetical protein